MTNTEAEFLLAILEDVVKEVKTLEKKVITIKQIIESNKEGE